MYSPAASQTDDHKITCAFNNRVNMNLKLNHFPVRGLNLGWTGCLPWFEGVFPITIPGAMKGRQHPSGVGDSGPPGKIGLIKRRGEGTVKPFTAPFTKRRRATRSAIMFIYGIYNNQKLEHL